MYFTSLVKNHELQFRSEYQGLHTTGVDSTVKGEDSCVSD